MEKVSSFPIFILHVNAVVGAEHSNFRSRHIRIIPNKRQPKPPPPQKLKSVNGNVLYIILEGKPLNFFIDILAGYHLEKNSYDSLKLSA